MLQVSTRTTSTTCSPKRCLAYQMKRGFAVKALNWCSSGVPERTDTPTKSARENKQNEEMMMPIERFGVVAAMSKNNVIGLDGKLPWNLPKDRHQFKMLTKDKVLVIGRKTFEEECDQSHISHARASIVVSQTLDDNYFRDENRISLARSFSEALHIARQQALDAGQCDPRSIFCWVAGGETLYNEAILHPACQALQLTVVETEIQLTKEGKMVPDLARFPAKYRWDNRFKRKSEEHLTDRRISYTVYEYERIQRRR